MKGLYVVFNCDSEASISWHEDERSARAAISESNDADSFDYEFLLWEDALEEIPDNVDLRDWEFRREPNEDCT